MDGGPDTSTTAGTTGGSAGIGGSSAGTGGASPDGGDAATASCTNTDTDPKNCGTCGHDCLGGTCSGSICHPFLLGSAPTDYVRDTFVSGGKVHIFVVTSAQTAGIWLLDAATPSAPSVVAAVPDVSAGIVC
jgi:hypothetical protein